ncbi:hypothetical protein DPMN_035996 [Dreissena polymorpha]|uniref:Uncharacterized protein n=1 Tax=Dreissena polymorpha TaxID=45954 RepID=A0A9D4RML9_DREPO|nr:hypothetical protein DPMN_035996 [Dreissena polymorpha]
MYVYIVKYEKSPLGSKPLRSSLSMNCLNPSRKDSGTKLALTLNPQAVTALRNLTSKPN